MDDVLSFPSDKAYSNYPRINIDGDCNDLAKWFEQHKEIDRRIPPVFPDFFIVDMYSTIGNHIVVCAHYNDDKTTLAFRAAMDDTRLLTATVDYNAINGDIVYILSTPTKAAEKYTREWTENFSLFCALSVLAAQAYLLYHKPEEVEIIYAAAQNRAANSEKKRKPSQKNGSVKIGSSMRRIIRINPRELPPREHKYNKLAWGVRGHYRRYGKDKHLKFISPYICNRGGAKRKPKAKTYTLEAKPKEPKKDG